MSTFDLSPCFSFYIFKSNVEKQKINVNKRKLYVRKEKKTSGSRTLTLQGCRAAGLLASIELLVPNHREAAQYNFNSQGGNVFKVSSGSLHLL